MKKAVLLFFLTFSLMAGEGLEYTFSLMGGYRSLKAKIGSQETSLNLTQGGIKNSVLVSENAEFYFGVLYGKTSFGDELTFTSLPVSLSTSYGKTSYSIFAGAFWEPYVFSEEISIVLNPEVSYNLSSYQWKVEKTSYLTGTVDGKVHFWDFRFGVLAMYEGQENIEPYVGVYFEYFMGSVSFEEKFQDLEAKSQDKLKPKLPVEIIIGTNFYGGEHLSGGISVGFLNGLSFHGELGFTF